MRSGTSRFAAGLLVATVILRGQAITEFDFLNADEAELMVQARAARLSPVPFSTWMTGTTGPYWLLFLAGVSILGVPLTLAFAHLLAAVLLAVTASALFVIASRAIGPGPALVATVMWWFPLAAIFLVGDLANFGALSTEYLPTLLVVASALVPREQLATRPWLFAVLGVLAGLAVGAKFQIAPLAAAFAAAQLIVLRPRVSRIVVSLLLVVGGRGAASGRDRAGHAGLTGDQLVARRADLLLPDVLLGRPLPGGEGRAHLHLAHRARKLPARSTCWPNLAEPAHGKTIQRGPHCPHRGRVGGHADRRQGLSPLPHPVVRSGGLGRHHAAQARRSPVPAAVIANRAGRSGGHFGGLRARERVHHRHLRPLSPRGALAAFSSDSVNRNPAMARACPPGSPALVWGWAPEIYIGQDWQSTIPYTTPYGLAMSPAIREAAEPVVRPGIEHAKCVVDATNIKRRDCPSERPEQRLTYCLPPTVMLTRIYPQLSPLIGQQFRIVPINGGCEGCTFYVRDDSS